MAELGCTAFWGAQNSILCSHLLFSTFSPSWPLHLKLLICSLTLYVLYLFKYNFKSGLYISNFWGLPSIVRKVPGDFPDFSFIHMVSPFYCWVILHGVKMPQSFNNPLAEEHLDSQIKFVMNRTALNTNVQVFLWTFLNFSGTNSQKGHCQVFWRTTRLGLECRTVY